MDEQMRKLACFLVMVAWSASGFAQSRTDGTLRVTVVDPSGAVIVGARVALRLATTPDALAQGGPPALETGPRGDATFAALEPGRYLIHVESPGFEPTDVRDYRVRAGDNRREGKLAL